MSEENKGFKVKDSRAASQENDAEATERDYQKASESSAANSSAPDSAESLPPIDFTTFVLSLGTSALIHLGEAPEALRSEAATANLPMARQTIDLLAMLEEKTKGNLTGEEERLLHQLVSDLKMRFVLKST